MITLTALIAATVALGFIARAIYIVSQRVMAQATPQPATQMGR